MKSSHLSGLASAAISRRTLLGGIAGAAALGAVGPLGRLALGAERKGRIKQSVCYWCFDGWLNQQKIGFEEFAKKCAEMGLKSIEIVSPDRWPILKKYGLTCALTDGLSIPKGFNRIENHDECIAKLRELIDVTSAAGFPNVVCFSGNREGMDDQEGLKNCVTGLKKIASYAEQKKVTLCLEFLNSIDHKDYMGDSTKWCVDFVNQVGSPRVKVLYDIYHAGMMKEDPMADIKKHHECWAHYHTGGVPGRNEIDDTQTQDYPKLMQAIVDTGYQGYVGQEFIPKRPDALKSLEQAVTICDV